jgi:hypothetical protein
MVASGLDTTNLTVKTCAQLCRPITLIAALLAMSQPLVGHTQSAAKLAQPSAPKHVSTGRRDESFGVYQGAGCTGSGRLAEFEQWFGSRPERALEFMSWEAISKNSTWSMRCWSKAGIKAVTYSIPMLPSDGSATLADGAAGKFDDIYARFAQTMVKEGYPDAVIRIGWEFNGDWYAWAAQKDPASWIAYWRRIVSIMRATPGAAFKFDWCPAGGWTTFLAQDAYPGDEYVDIIGLDFYNVSWDPKVKTPEQRWDSRMKMRHGLKWHKDFATAHHKPVSFPEWGTGTRPDGRGGGDDPYFIEQMAQWIASSDVVYHNYWNYPDKEYNAKLSDGQQPLAGSAFIRSFKRAATVQP